MLIESWHVIVDRLSVNKYSYSNINSVYITQSGFQSSKHLRCSAVHGCVVRHALSGCLQCYLKRKPGIHLGLKHIHIVGLEFSLLHDWRSIPA